MVRSSEYDLPPEMLDDIVAQSISTYGVSSSLDNRPHLGRRRAGDFSDDEDENI